MKKLVIASLVATAFAPFTFATPAFAEEGNPSLCSSNNPNIFFDTQVYGGDEVTETGDPVRAGSSGNVSVLVTVKSGPVYQDCLATNVRSGNAVPGQSQTDILVDEGGDIIEEYSVKVCQNLGQAPGTEVTTEGVGLGFTQAQCEALTA